MAKQSSYVTNVLFQLSRMLSQQHPITLSGANWSWKTSPLFNKPINYYWASVEQRKLIYCYH